jgi:hypothetical protein
MICIESLFRTGSLPEFTLAQAGAGMTARLNCNLFTKDPKNVIPAKAGIQKLLKLLDPCLRRDDKKCIFQHTHNSNFPHLIFHRVNG